MNLRLNTFEGYGEEGDFDDDKDNSGEEPTDEPYDFDDEPEEETG